MPDRMLVGSNNQHKIGEFRRILTPLGIEVVAPSETGVDIEVVETGRTFSKNARIKAIAFRDVSGFPSVADDSGLMVDALGGEPGFYSARYGGPGLTDVDRNYLVLSRLGSLPSEQRKARFVCAIALAEPGNKPILFMGEVEGEIALKPQGVRGFGYDPIFFHPPSGSTFGQLTPDEKDAVSHRGIALRRLAAFLTARRDGIL